jgi:hypothetical protein
MIILFMILGLNTTQVFSWNGMPTPALHVEGRFLKDPSGNNVVLRGGWMQPTETWFNGGGRWYNNPTDWTSPSNVAGVLNFLNGAATLMSDTSPKYGTNHGWYTTFVRVNTDAIGGWTQAAGLVDQAQFNGWIQNFLVPYANHLKSRGLYLVLCATGPINTSNNGSHNAGVTEGQRLRTFWSTVANAPGVKNADNIMFELMNEPVDIESTPGNGDWGHGQSKYYLAFRNWIQPVINDIRSTGANNVIWVPTLEWEGSPKEHVQYPFTGTNCGVAVHYYPTYGGCGDNVSCHNNLWNSNYKLAADIWPMIITENFWFPEDTGLDKGSTANYGNTLRANITKEGNVSYMIGFLSDLLDDLTKALPANCNLSSKQGAQAAFEWFYQENSCTPTSITPYVKVNSGAWISSSTITVNVGDALTIGPQLVTGGSWSWTGPTSFSDTNREIILTKIQSNQGGIYTVTYTNTGGCKTIVPFTVTVNVPCTPTTIIPYFNVNGGTWTNSTSVNVTAGGAVTLGPQPLTGGSWSWSGPNAFTASTREILFNNVQSNQSGSYVATYTNAAGCKSSSTFTLNVNAPPTVSISSPIGGTSFTDPANITITVSATDADGTISKVEYLDNNTVIGTSTSVPYSFVWTSPSPGAHIITVRVTDNNGGITTSAPVTVTSLPATTGLYAANSNALNAVVYPNPSNGIVFVDSESDVSDATFMLVDVLGNEHTVPHTANGMGAQINVSNLSAGTYVLIIKKDNTVMRKKITVLF